MRVDKDSIDYQVNLVALQEMEEAVPMTLRERRCLRKWVHKGNEVESNPWNYMNSDGMPLNYLQAFASDLAIPTVHGTTGKALTQSFFGMNSTTAFSPKMNSFN